MNLLKPRRARFPSDCGNSEAATKTTEQTLAERSQSGWRERERERETMERTRMGKGRKAVRGIFRGPQFRGPLIIS